MQNLDISFLEKELEFRKSEKLQLQKENADCTNVSVLVNILKLLVSDLKTKASSVNFRFEPTTVVNTIRSYIEGAETSLKYTRDIATINKLKLEITFLNTFIPSQLSDDAIIDIIEGFLNKNPNSKMGAVMEYFKNTYAGRYDGKYLSSFVNAYLKTK